MTLEAGQVRVNVPIFHDGSVLSQDTRPVPQVRVLTSIALLSRECPSTAGAGQVRMNVPTKKELLNDDSALSQDARPFQQG